MNLNKLAAAELTYMSYFESTGGYTKMAAMPEKYNSISRFFKLLIALSKMMLGLDMLFTLRAQLATAQWQLYIKKTIKQLAVVA